MSAVTGRVSENFAQHIDCFAKESEELVRIFSLVDVDSFDPSSSATAQFMAIVEGELETVNWKPDFLISPNLPSEVPEGNYLIDFHKVFTAQGCNSKHLATVEFCFDNRQAIAGNICKANLAAAAFNTDSDHVAASYLVTLSPEVRKSGRWDNSVGRTPEYEYAVEIGYSSLVNSPIFIVSII